MASIWTRARVTSVLELNDKPGACASQLSFGVELRQIAIEVYIQLHLDMVCNRRQFVAGSSDDKFPCD